MKTVKELMENGFTWANEDGFVLENLDGDVWEEVPTENGNGWYLGEIYDTDYLAMQPRLKD